MRENPVRTLFLPLLLAALVVVSPSFAAGPVEEESAVSSEGRTVQRRIAARAGAFVNLKNLAGSLKVEGWDRDEVAVEGTLGAGVQELRLETDGQRVWLEVKLRGEPGKQHGAAELHVQLPAKSRLEVRTVEAPTVLQGFRGRVDFESVTGDFLVQGGKPEEIIATTVSGRLVIAAPALRLRARSVGGLVRIEQEVEDLVVRTGSGPVELVSRVVREARLESVSGRIQVMAEMADQGRLQVFVHDGRAELALPEDLAAVFHLETARGTIESDFGPPLPARQDDHRQEVRFRTGTGHARVEARSISGTLRLIAHSF